MLVLHGPNLNTPGTREPAIYGSMVLAQIQDMLHHSAIAALCQGHIVGLGWRGSLLAFKALVALVHKRKKEGKV